MRYVPLEVEEFIFDQYLTIIPSPDLWNIQKSGYLSNVALVGRRWRMRANAHRFAHLELVRARTWRDYPSKMNALVALIKTDIWTSGEKFAEFVQNVTLKYDTDSHTGSHTVLDPNFIFNDSHIVSILDAIFRTPFLSESQRFYYSARGRSPGYRFKLQERFGKRQIQFQDTDNEIVRAIEELCTTPFLSKLSLQNLGGLPLTLFSSPSLTNLHLQRTSFTSLSKSGPVSQTALQRLTTLSFDTSSDLTNLGFHDNPPSRLSDLSLDMSSILSWDKDAREALKQVYHLSRTLLSLGITFANVARPIYDYPIRSRLGQLSRLELTFNKRVSLIPQITDDDSSPMECLMSLLPLDHAPSISMTVNVNVVLSEYYNPYAFSLEVMYLGLDEVHAQLDDGPLAEYLANNPNPYVPIRPTDSEYSLYLNFNVSHTYMKYRTAGDNPTSLSWSHTCMLESYLRQKYVRLGSISGTFVDVTADDTIDVHM